MDLETFYGGSVVTMTGKNCVSIICDNRLGAGPITTSKEFTRIFQITEKILVGLTVFLPDAQFLLKEIEKHVELFKLQSGREIEPEECANLLSAILYSHRASPLYVSPVVIGLDSNNNTYVCSMDCLGCKCEPKNFVAEGTASLNLTGMCEVLYREDMNEEELFTTSVQVFLNSIDRDALSGWGAQCTILTPTERKVRKIKGRID
jgi:20S proteasome subunit beta 3